MSDSVAFYLFGYYALQCTRSKNFWLGEYMIEKESIYWSLFRHFAQQMEKMEKLLVAQEIKPENLRF